MRVPFFRYPSVFESQSEELVEQFMGVGARGAFILQNDLREFEESLACRLGVKFAVGVGNCTDGLLLALRAAGIGPGDEVLFCSHTMVATAAAIHFCGATPVPVECGADHLMDPLALEQAVTSKTRAVMPTQLNGRVCEMDRIREVADRHELIIVEDAAQALGAKFRGTCAGAFGLAGAFSFYPAKTLACLGDGGAVVTNDAEIYRKLLLLRDHGRNEEGDVVAWGLNSRLDNLQAAFLNCRLPRYDAEIERRRDIAAEYQSRLGAIEELQLPPGPDSHPDHFDIFQNYEIEAERRDDLREFLKERGIGTLVQWGGKAVHQFRKLGFDVSLPFTERMFERCLLLPMNTFLSDDDVTYVCECIAEFYEAGA